MAGDASEPGEESSAGPAVDAESLLSPAARSSLLWGVVGGLAFLVLVQGYELFAAVPVGLGAKLGVAALVTVGAAGLTYAARDRLPAPGDGE